MQRRLVQDVMTRDVTTVHVGTGFRQMVRSLLDHGIGALPVVDDTGRVLGVVSETDLLAKRISGIEVEPRAWTILSHDGRRTHGNRRATVAARLMTEPPIVVGVEASLARAAYLMIRHDVRHLPVVDADGRLLGIVSRSDLLTEYLRDDDEIRHDVIDEVLVDQFGLDTEKVKVEVEHGRVALLGNVDHATTAAGLVHAAEQIPGVVLVTSTLKWQTDDLSVHGQRAATK